MSGGAIAAIVIVLVLVLVGAGVGIWYAVSQSSDSSESKTGSTLPASSSVDANKRAYNFYEHYDSNGNDIISVSPYKYSSIPDLLQKCNNTPGCVAVNTQGWLKDKINSSLNKDVISFADAGQGVYILNANVGSYTSAIPVTSTATERFRGARNFERFVNW
jgi:hypothetical protein